MKNVFKKSDLPLIDKAVHGDENFKEHLDLYYKIRVEDGFVRHISTEVILLERAAIDGNLWAIWELAQHYYYDESVRNIPIALSWWKRAVELGSEAARDRYRMMRGEIICRILSYAEGHGDYSDLELRLAMLTEIYLFELGTVSWESFSDEERLRRVNELCSAVIPLLDTPFSFVRSVPGLTHTYSGGRVGIVDALAHPDDRSISVRREVLRDSERMVALIIHELGHLVCFRACGDLEYAKRWGLTPERISTWYKNIIGYEVTTEEEDPDTLSYGVYTNWAILFAKRR